MKKFSTYELVLKKQGDHSYSSLGKPVSNESEAAAILHELLDECPMEKVYALLIDGSNHLIGVVQVAMGGLHGCALTPRDLLVPSLVGGASAIIMGHNHPSGDPTPSSDDIGMTADVGRACEQVGLILLDHIVVTRNGKHASIIDVLRQRMAA